MIIYTFRFRVGSTNMDINFMRWGRKLTFVWEISLWFSDQYNDNKLTLKNLPCLGNAYEIYKDCIGLHSMPSATNIFCHWAIRTWLLANSLNDIILNDRKHHQKKAKQLKYQISKIIATLFYYRHIFVYRWRANVDIANKLSLPEANCINLCTLNSLQIWGLADIEMQIKPNTGRNIKPKQTKPKQFNLKSKWSKNEKLSATNG